MTGVQTCALPIYFGGEDAARKQLEYLVELRRQKRLETRENLQKKRARLASMVFAEGAEAAVAVHGLKSWPERNCGDARP